MAVEGKKYTLKSSDAVEFEVEEAVAMKSHMIKLMIEDDCANDKIPVPNVTGEVLTKVIEYCEKHVDMQKQMDLEDKKAVVVEEDLKAWDAAFVNVDQAVLFHLILAANYLEINSLLDLTIQKVVDIIKGKSPEEIRTIFNIKNDFTPEEEEEIRKENRWAFE